MTGTTTKPSAEARALEIMCGDWDEDGTSSPAIPRETAMVILERRGWTIGTRGEWLSPGGRAFWHTDEALSIALVAEAV